MRLADADAARVVDKKMTKTSSSELQLILGSGSARRRELLGQVGLVPADIRVPDIDEDPRPNELPRDYVNRIAHEKIAAIAGGENEVILCADTTVALGRRIMGKPSNADEAGAFLRAMSGRRHKVITAVTVKRGAQLWRRDVQTTLAMKRLSDKEITSYLATEDWVGKAGGYAIQGPAGAFIPWINGSYTGVVGLPLAETLGLLVAAGLDVHGASG